MPDDKIYEGTSRGKSVYFVSLDRGNIEITFDKKTLAWKKAMVYDGGMEPYYYGSKELKAFRHDYSGVFEYAAGMLARQTGRNVPIPKERKVVRRK